MLFEGMFERTYKIHTVRSGEKGLEFLHSRPDTNIVFCDQRMPTMSGLDFIKKAQQDFPAIPFYLLTGLDCIEEIHQALQNGTIKGYMQKPFIKEDIEKTIRESIEKQM